MNTNRRLAAVTVANALLALPLAGAIAVAGLTHDAPLAGSVGPSETSTATNAAKPANVPVWTDEVAAAFPACVAALPEGEIPARVVVVTLDGSVEAITLDDLFSRTRASEVWTVGACRA